MFSSLKFELETQSLAETEAVENFAVADGLANAIDGAGLDDDAATERSLAAVPLDDELGAELAFDDQRGAEAVDQLLIDASREPHNLAVGNQLISTTIADGAFQIVVPRFVPVGLFVFHFHSHFHLQLYPTLHHK